MTGPGEVVAVIAHEEGGVLRVNGQLPKQAGEIVGRQGQDNDALEVAGSEDRVRELDRPAAGNAPLDRFADMQAGAGGLLVGLEVFPIGD